MVVNNVVFPLASKHWHVLFILRSAAGLVCVSLTDALILQCANEIILHQSLLQLTRNQCKCKMAQHTKRMKMYIIHYDGVIMTTMTAQITSLTVVYSTVYSVANQRKHQSSASLAFVRGIHRDRWIPRTKGQSRGKCFHLMTSSWFTPGACFFFLPGLVNMPI